MPTLTESFEHELLQLFHHPDTGLVGAVAIHSTALGPAMGGLRLARYADAEAAAVDALRLARAMTLKTSATGLDLGGGKAVLVDDGKWGTPHTRRARMLALADVIERLGGRYVTAEDVGTAPADMDLIATRTRWVVGRSPANGGRGDPSPATAQTVFGAITAAVLSHLGTSLDGVHVGVLGAGKVGAGLVARLAAAGARVTVADIAHDRARACAAASPSCVAAVELDGFVSRELDVLAPCALGELIAADDVGALRCQIVAGAANNPLIDRATAVALHDAGILYVPDFIANSGGIVYVAAEFHELDVDAVDRQVAACVARAGAMLDEARSRGVMPLDVALERATARIAAARGLVTA